MLCLSRQAWVLWKLVQVIDFLGGLSLLKESTLSMELLPQPLRWADSISHYCKFLPKRLKWLRLIGNAMFCPGLILLVNKFDKNPVKLLFPVVLKPIESKCFALRTKCFRPKKNVSWSGVTKRHLWQIWTGWEGRELAHILISQFGRHVSPDQTR